MQPQARTDVNCDPVGIDMFTGSLTRSSPKHQQLIAQLEKERDEHKAQLEARKNAGVKRLNELTWPKEWTRAQKRRCVQACKRAKKKGFIPNTKKWDDELARAGFKPTVKK